jgi:hypothetical protein
MACMFSVGCLAQKTYDGEKWSMSNGKPELTSLSSMTSNATVQSLTSMQSSFHKPAYGPIGQSRFHLATVSLPNGKFIRAGPPIWTCAIFWSWTLPGSQNAIPGLPYLMHGLQNWKLECRAPPASNTALISS